METKLPEEKNEELASVDEWENRILCSDGNCIGVIGLDGHCKECGKKYEGALPEEVLSVETAPPEDDGLEEESELEQVLEQEDELPADPDWEDRILCSDGNCIGVIGPDRRCKECGKPYEGNTDP